MWADRGAAKVQQVTTLQLRSNSPARARRFCHGFVMELSVLDKIGPSEASPFSPLSHSTPPSFFPSPPFLSFPPLFSFTPPTPFFSFLTPATPRQDVLPAPPPGAAPTPLSLLHQDNLVGEDGRGAQGGG